MATSSPFLPPPTHTDHTLSIFAFHPQRSTNRKSVGFSVYSRPLSGCSPCELKSSSLLFKPLETGSRRTSSVGNMELRFRIDTWRMFSLSALSLLWNGSKPADVSQALKSLPVSEKKTKQTKLSRIIKILSKNRFKVNCTYFKWPPFEVKWWVFLRPSPELIMHRLMAKQNAMLDFMEKRQKYRCCWNADIKGSVRFTVKTLKKSPAQKEQRF